MKILVVGANSYAGAAIYTQLREKYEVVGTYNAYPLFEELIQLDITHVAEVERAIKQNAPDIIVHVASNSNGNWCEQHPELAYAINVQATPRWRGSVTRANMSIHIANNKVTYE